MQQIFDLILRLAEIRKPVSQFLFSDAVLGLQEIELRKQVLKYKSTSGSIKEIDVIVNSPGGSADSAYRMIRTFRKNFEHVNIIVPFWAKSAATLLSLGGTKIIWMNMLNSGHWMCN
jgi:ClpP class serine protease